MQPPSARMQHCDAMLQRPHLSSAATAAYPDWALRAPLAPFPDCAAAQPHSLLQPFLDPFQALGPLSHDDWAQVAPAGHAGGGDLNNGSAWDANGGCSPPSELADLHLHQLLALQQQQQLAAVAAPPHLPPRVMSQDSCMSYVDPLPWLPRPASSSALLPPEPGLAAGGAGVRRYEERYGNGAPAVQAVQTQDASVYDTLAAAAAVCERYQAPPCMQVAGWAQQQMQQQAQQQQQQQEQQAQQLQQQQGRQQAPAGVLDLSHAGGPYQLSVLEGAQAAGTAALRQESAKSQQQQQQLGQAGGSGERAGLFHQLSGSLLSLLDPPDSDMPDGAATLQRSRSGGPGGRRFGARTDGSGFDCLEGQGDDCVGGAAGHKTPRLRWTTELHEEFVRSIETLGGEEKATPKAIWRLMQHRGLALHHVKSHLQKYRLAAKQLPAGPPCNGYSLSRHGSLSYSHHGLATDLLSNGSGSRGFGGSHAGLSGTVSQLSEHALLRGATPTLPCGGGDATHHRLQQQGVRVAAPSSPPSTTTPCVAAAGRAAVSALSSEAATAGQERHSGAPAAAAFGRVALSDAGTGSPRSVQLSAPPSTKALLNDALQMQLRMQQQLTEQLERQRSLQSMLEEHSRHLDCLVRSHIDAAMKAQP